MDWTTLKASLNLTEIGEQAYRLIVQLYPLCRSITGEGVRQTLAIVQQHIPLVVHEVPTGTRVFDWTVPKEWEIRNAYIKNAKGERIVDFQKSNLHVVSYSAPVRGMIPLAELKGHLFSLPHYPDWIPYRTAYYKENWGFCLTHNQLLALDGESYEVLIDSSLKDGYLTYGEFYLPGATQDEVLLTCHICHPSLCNDNLSGIALLTLLAKSLASQPRRYSYRFLFIPATIGSITWLARNEACIPGIKHGLVLACVGDPGHSTYKKSRRGDAEIDQAVRHVLEHSGQEYEILDFSPYGYDERQFCSPGFNLPVGCLMRTPHGRFPEYHTSADNPDLVRPECLADSFSKCLAIVNVLENNKTYLNQNPKCEPQLGKRGLYSAMGGQAEARMNELAMLWVLNLSDGMHTLLDIAGRAGVAFDTLQRATQALLQHGLLKECEKAAGRPAQTQKNRQKMTSIAIGDTKHEESKH
jgi:aminopeptidase-like protein